MQTTKIDKSFHARIFWEGVEHKSGSGAEAGQGRLRQSLNATQTDLVALNSKEIGRLLTLNHNTAENALTI